MPAVLNAHRDAKAQPDRLRLPDRFRVSAFRKRPVKGKSCRGDRLWSPQPGAQSNIKVVEAHHLGRPQSAAPTGSRQIANRCKAIVAVVMLLLFVIVCTVRAFDAASLSTSVPSPQASANTCVTCHQQKGDE